MKKQNKGELEIVYIPLSKIKPYANNPRVHTKKAIQDLANSIKNYGFLVPILLDKTNTIICGHTRYFASKKLKLSTVPATYGTHLSEKQIREFRVIDNKTSENGQWDYTKLLLEVDQIGKSVPDSNQNDVMQSRGFDDETFELMVNTRPISQKKTDVDEIRIIPRSSLHRNKIIKLLDKHKISYRG